MFYGDHKKWHKIWESVKSQKYCFCEDLAETLQMCAKLQKT
jgi:hypothetical protein